MMWVYFGMLTDMPSGGGIKDVTLLKNSNKAASDKCLMKSHIQQAYMDKKKCKRKKKEF